MRTLTIDDIRALEFELNEFNPKGFELKQTESGDYQSFGYGYASFTSKCGVSIEFGYYVQGSGPNYEDAFNYRMIADDPDNEDAHIILDGANLLNDDGKVLCEYDVQLICRHVLYKDIVWQRHILPYLPTEHDDLDN
ncbi:hypothetical protein [Photobacterium sp. J15]|uniref:hypothetical protein n=1 Tax=Photobacterium sp. J15 TaxID=265901 RepID=UPI0007E33B9F|nr:hypothetical protein [Photobacterium sp. J15]